MNIVIITTLSRPDLFEQTINSLIDNAEKPMSHHYTMVIDHYSAALVRGNLPRHQIPVDVMVKIADQVGASRCRNIGAGSIPKYLRQKHVMFCDDDIYACPGWDEKLMDLATWSPTNIISGYSHPFNNCERWEVPMATGRIHVHGKPLVISSVAMMMPWWIFDTSGPWDEPGGPGGSEDFALCMRARDEQGIGFAVSDPQVILHTGLMSSTGKQIVGYTELAEQNDKLLDVHGIRGKVVFG